jgi:hypothetical protein
MATMSMNKVIHSAFRRDLDRFAGALDGFRDGDAARAADLGRAWDNFDAQLTDHHEGEHEVAWPHLERAGVATDLLAQMDAEHGVMLAALEEAREAMTALRSDPSAARAATARQAVERLRRATVDHLDHEERELEPFYLEHHDHPEVVAMSREFRKRNVSGAGQFLAWVTDGATPEERASIAVPPPVFAVMTGLFGRRYRKDIAPVWRQPA